MRSINDAFNEQLTLSSNDAGGMSKGRSGGIKDKLACFEKTIKQNNEAGVTSGMYLNNMLTKSGQNTRTSRGGLDCTNSSKGLGSQFPRRSSIGTSTTVSCSSPDVDDFASNSSVHSGYTITDRTSDFDDDSSISCDSFGEGDDDDCEVPSIVEDINSNRSKRNNNTGSGSRKILIRRRATGTTKSSRSHANGIPETIFESNGDSRHSRKSKSSQKSGKRSSSRSRDSHESEDSDADSFC